MNTLAALLVVAVALVWKFAVEVAAVVVGLIVWERWFKRR
jgi:hypothetical protein